MSKEAPKSPGPGEEEPPKNTGSEASQNIDSEAERTEKLVKDAEQILRALDKDVRMIFAVRRKMTRIREDVPKEQLNSLITELHKIQSEWNALGADGQTGEKKTELRTKINTTLNTYRKIPEASAPESGTAPPATEPPASTPEPGTTGTAEPPEASTAPAEATEKGPEVGTEQTEEETPQSPTELRNRAIDAFANAYDKFKDSRFMRDLRGEKQEEELTGEYSKKDYARMVATGFVSMAMTYTGTKIAADLPRWFTQKYYTGKERERLLKAVEDADAAFNREAPIASNKLVEHKQTAIAERIKASKFLTPEQKTKLTEQINLVVETYNSDLESKEQERNEKIAQLLDEAIQARVKGTTVLKEGLNTAMVATGIASLRTLGYTAVAMYERHQKVSKERKKEETTGAKDYLNRYVVQGVTETISKLGGGGAETRTGRNLNRMQAAGVLMRAFTVAGIAQGDFEGGQGFSGLMEKLSEKWSESDGLMDYAGSNLQDQYKPMWDSASSLFTSSEGEPDITEATAEATETSAMQAMMAEQAAEPGIMTEADTSGQYPESIPVEAALDATPETAHELSPELVEQAVVKADNKHNSITALLVNQLKANSADFGYTGDPSGVDAWAQQQALEATQQAGIVQSGGDLRLGTNAIDRLAVLASPDGEGGVVIEFFDTQTNDIIPTDQLLDPDAGLTYVHGSLNESLLESEAPSAPEGADVSREVPETDAETGTTETEGGAATESPEGAAERGSDAAITERSEVLRQSDPYIRGIYEKVISGEYHYTDIDTPPRVEVVGGDVQALLAKQGLELNGQGIFSGKPDTSLSFMSQIVDANGDLVSKPAEILVGTDGDTLILNMIDQNGIIEEVRYEDGVITSASKIDVPSIARGAEGTADVWATEDTENAPEVPSDGEPLKTFKGEDAKIRFQYHKNEAGNKEVWDAFLPGFSEAKFNDQALENWGLTEEQINQGFLGEGTPIVHPAPDAPMTTDQFARGVRYNQEPNNATDSLVRRMARLEGFTGLLQEMGQEGYSGTPEFRMLAEKIADENKIIAGELGRIGIDATREQRG